MTRAVGRASHFSSQIHLTRVLALIYSTALPRGDVPHLHVLHRTAAHHAIESPAHHLSEPQRAEL